MLGEGDEFLLILLVSPIEYFLKLMDFIAVNLHLLPVDFIKSEQICPELSS